MVSVASNVVSEDKSGVDSKAFECYHKKRRIGDVN
jgi:hypothetical protein